MCSPVLAVHLTPSDLQPTFDLKKLVLRQALLACPSVHWGDTICYKPVWRLCSEFMFLQSTECGTNVYFRLCLSNKASRSFQQCHFVAVLHAQFAYFVMDVNLLRVTLKMSLKFKANEQFSYN